MSFVLEGDIHPSDERIELPDGGIVFVERKAIWVGEGGLLGATMDIDDDFTMKIIPKEPKT